MTDLLFTLSMEGTVMKIEGSDVLFFTSHQKKSEISEKETLEMWDSKEDAPERFRALDRLELTDNFKKQHNMQTGELDDELGGAGLDSKLMSIIRAIESLTGKKINLSFLKKLNSSETKTPQTEPSNTPNELQGWGVIYQHERHEVKEESLNFSAQGSVKTQDGRAIDFSFALSMQNRSESHESMSFKAGDALIDPLVINFGTATVSISDIEHEFDLNLDGKSDTFNFVGNGSGFLVLDKNKDGLINDGSELFGPTLGNGFKELSAYDIDANNWIDESDAIFKELLIWTKDDKGTENLFTLKEKGIGALYLETATTPWELKNSSNSAGVMKESSIYLNENGTVGTMQEIDLKV